MKLNDDIALITGASRGIGRAIAEHLGSLGAYVIGTATSEQGAGAISDYLSQGGHRGLGMVVDVGNEQSVDQLFAQLAERSKSVSILVNNAGITRDNLFVRMKPPEWDDVINTNLSSMYRLSKACTRAMLKARHGRIINITSVVGATGNAGQVNYASAKAGIMGFTKALAKELGARNITVNAVAPGFIDTDMTRQLGDETRTALIAQIPLHRLGKPEDIAHAVGFLAGPHGSYITGTTLHVNGGMYMS